MSGNTYSYRTERGVLGSPRGASGGKTEETPGGKPGVSASRSRADSWKISRAESNSGQMRPRPRTASRSSSSSFTEASMRVRENSLISRPWTISYAPSLQTTGKEEIRPSGTP